LEDNDLLRTHPSRNATHESYDLVVTHKVGTTGDIPVTNGLIEGFGFGPSKHMTLKVRAESSVESTCFFSSNATHYERSIDSASKLETEHIE
jgi:hypothetical protein